MLCVPLLRFWHRELDAIANRHRGVCIAPRAEGRRGGDQMSKGKTINETALRTAAILLAAIIVAMAPTSGIFAATHMGSGGSSSASEAATPPAIAEFMALLADPKVQKWLEQQHPAQASHKLAPQAETVSRYFDYRVGATRAHITALAAAL